jgi:hypothetical protein
MSVEGLKQTDLFSFGLLIWRVLTNKSVPYEILGQGIIDRYRAPDKEAFIVAVKKDSEFCGIVLHSLRYSSIAEWAKTLGMAILPHALGLDPTSRCLQKITAGIRNAGGKIHKRSASKSYTGVFTATSY